MDIRFHIASTSTSASWLRKRSGSSMAKKPVWRPCYRTERAHGYRQYLMDVVVQTKVATADVILSIPPCETLIQYILLHRRLYHDPVGSKTSKTHRCNYSDFKCGFPCRLISIVFVWLQSAPQSEQYRSSNFYLRRVPADLCTKTLV